MTLDIAKIQENLCTQMCADIRLIQRKGRVIITTPFMFPDGDNFILYLEEKPGGLLRLTDGGHTLMHLSYENDIDKFREDVRGSLFEQILANGGLTEEQGEISIDTYPNDLNSVIFQFSQALIGMNNLTFLNRLRAESTFYADLKSLLLQILDPDKIQENYIYPGIENPADYPIDYRVAGKSDPLFIFGIPNRDKARLATIVLERLLRANADFESVLIFSDQSSLPRSDLARLSNAGGEMIASLDAHDDLQRKITRRAA